MKVSTIQDINLELFGKESKDLLDKYDELKSKLDDPKNHNYGNPEELIPYCESLKNIDKPKVLALGGSIGFEAYRFKVSFPDAEMYSLDIVPETVEVGKMFFKNNEVNFITSTMSIIPLSDNFLDCIFCIQSLEHTDDIIKTMKEVHRVLKNGGLFVLIYPYKWATDGVHKYMFEDDMYDFMKQLGEVVIEDSVQYRSKKMKLTIRK